MTVAALHNVRLSFNPRGRRCFAGHLGLWSVESRWMSSAVALLNAGVIRPLDRSIGGGREGGPEAIVPLSSMLERRYQSETAERLQALPPRMVLSLDRRPTEGRSEAPAGARIEADTNPARSAASSSGSRNGLRMEAGGIAVIEVVGQMTKEDSSFGGTNTVRTRREMRIAAADPDVTGILLVLDSPGGTVDGTNELAQDVRAVTARKPVFAHIEDLGASAAYWVAAQADRLSANATALVGSIGTVAVVADLSQSAADAGIKVHVISTGPLKGAFTPGTEITEAMLADLQERVDDTNAFFLAAVQEGRGLDAREVAELADGRVMISEKARAAGLIDVVESLDDTFAALFEEVSERSQGGGDRRRRTALVLAKAREAELHARILASSRA